MRKLDLLMCLALLAVCALFYFLTLQLPPAAMIYPLFVTSVLLILTVLQLFIAYFRRKDEKSKAFDKIEWKQMGLVLGNSFIYLVLINVLGYVSASFLYVISTLLLLKTGKKSAVLVSVVFVALLYVLFQMILKVPLPKGLLI